MNVFAAYLHDVADVLLYLLTPTEDFRSRPFRFLVREVFVKRILLPVLDMLSDPDFINHSIVWLNLAPSSVALLNDCHTNYFIILKLCFYSVLPARLIEDHFVTSEEQNNLAVKKAKLSETNLKPEDFITILETTDSMKILDAVLDSLCEESAHLRTKDSGGEQDTLERDWNDGALPIKGSAADGSFLGYAVLKPVFLGFLVKQQLASIDYAKNVIKRRMEVLASAAVENDFQKVAQRNLPSDDCSTVQLPIHVVLTNNTAVTFFADYLASVGGQNLIDCYLAVEGFKASVEHQLRELAVGETLENDVYETVKEAANFLYQQYLSQEAITRVSLDDVTVKRFLTHIRNDDPPDMWFEQIQSKIVDILRTDERFYEAFKKDLLYAKMLAELEVGEESDREKSQNSNSSDESNNQRVTSLSTSSEIKNQDGRIMEQPHVGMHVVVETLGIGQQGKQTFALYNVRVSRIDATGKQCSSWNVLRRYSDFHALHSLIQSRVNFHVFNTFFQLSSLLRTEKLPVIRFSDFGITKQRTDGRYRNLKIV
ncbi:unnamed protein product [Gongylonema pulchrum]|uniref:Sorting nexin-13 n=1 Tax=Gongylonema pulchrum TaxID=637853 RepID=A0A183CYB1_9BILA|nr:unnamed protein product [Gongylonema pulchrum]